MRNLKVQKLDNNTKPEGIKITQDRFTLVLIIFLILMFLILVIFISLAFVYYNKITEEVSHLMNGDIEKLRKEVNELKNEEPSCERGWLKFEGHCYFFSDFKLNWTEAEKMCLNRESHLVIITSQAEQSFLIQHHNSTSYWIGMTDIETEGQYRWVDGTLLLLSSYKFWKDGEPNDGKRNEDCVHLYDQAKWNDVSCDEKLNAICEKRLL